MSAEIGKKIAQAALAIAVTIISDPFAVIKKARALWAGDREVVQLAPNREENKSDGTVTQTQQQFNDTNQVIVELSKELQQERAEKRNWKKAAIVGIPVAIVATAAITAIVMRTFENCNERGT